MGDPESGGSANTTVSFERVEEGRWEQIAKRVVPGAALAAESVARELAAAKELAQVAELMRSLLEIGNLNAVTTESLRDSLTNRGGGGFRVGVPPGNEETTQPGPLDGLPRSTSKTERHRYRPNLSIGRGGFASQGGPTNIGQPTGAHGTISRGDDGTTVVTRTEKYSSGTTITTSVTYDSAGNTTRTDSRVADPDGSTHDSGVVQTDSGGWVEYEIETDKEGNVVRNEGQEFDVNGDPVKDPDLAGQPGVDQGSESDLVDYLQSWHRSVYGPKYFEIRIPAHFNPGTPENADSDVKGPRLRHEGIAVNPDPTNVSGQDGLSRERLKHMQDELRKKAGGGFGPGPKPPNG